MNAVTGDRVAFKVRGHTQTRTVTAHGEGYVVVFFQGQHLKVPTHKLSSVIKGAGC